MRNPTGGLRATPLAICAPHTGGFTDVESVPAPVTYQLHIIDPGHGVKKVEVIPSTIASGRTMGFGEARIVDADDHDRVIAVCSGSGIRLAVAPGEFQPIEPAADIPDTDALPPLHEAFGCRRRADGRWELPELDITTASTSASLHLGPAQVLLEVAAEELAVEAAGTDQLQVEDWTVMFVARGSVGPFVVSGQAWSGADGRTAVHLELRDEQGRPGDHLGLGDLPHARLDHRVGAAAAVPPVPSRGGERRGGDGPGGDDCAAAVVAGPDAGRP